MEAGDKKIFAINAKISRRLTIPTLDDLYSVGIIRNSSYKNSICPMAL